MPVRDGRNAEKFEGRRREGLSALPVKRNAEIAAPASIAISPGVGERERLGR